MNGKVALVTGSTCGIGLGIAKALANRGCHIIVTGLGTEQVITSAVTEIASVNKDVKVNYVSADLRNVSDIRAMCTDIDKLYPDGLDILVNNAGFTLYHNVEGYSTEDWNDSVAVMLSAAFYLTRYAIPAMKKKGWGRIVNMSSTLGIVSGPSKAVYSAVKAGLIGFTKGVALELAENGITCNAVCPTFVSTGLVDQHLEKASALKNISKEQVLVEFLSPVPTKRITSIEQVAELVEFLCCSGASNQMTGAAYMIDGGLTAH